MRAALLVVALVCVGPVAAAEAQYADAIVTFGSGKISHSRTALVHAGGEVTVDFTGPAGTGTVTWTPAAHNVLQVFRLGSGHVRRLGGFLSLAQFGVAQDTIAVVHRTRADGSVATCADSPSADTEGFAALSGSSTALELDLRTAGPPLQTRCAGPLTSDVEKAMPKVEVPITRLVRGTTVDLSATRPFAAGGLSGTIRSTLVLKTGRLVADKGGLGSLPPGIHLHKVRVVYRTVVAHYEVQRVTGTLTAALAGSSVPECEALDSCDQSGTLTFGPAGAHGSVDWEATSSNGAGFARLRRALGLRGTAPRDITPFGSGDLRHGAANVAQISAGDGSERCADSGPPAGSYLGIERRGDTARVDLVPQTLRTRCPGPDSQSAVARAYVPLASFRHRLVTLHLTPVGRLLDDGWSASTSGSVTVVLRRAKVTQIKRILHEERFTGPGAR